MFATAPNFYLSSAAPPTCTLGTAPGQRPRSFSGKSRTYTDGGWEGLLHVVTLSNLAADGNTRYYYSCDGSAEFSFVSPPAPGSLPLTIAAVADLGSNCDKMNKAGDGSIGGTQGCGNATIDALATAVAKNELDLLVHAGDIAYTSGKQAIWDTFLRDMEPIAARLPYQVCVGNHEHYYNFSGYLHRFEMPKANASHYQYVATPLPDPRSEPKRPAPMAASPDNLFFSFDVGGVHWLAYSTEHDLQQQIPFMRADLAAVDRRVTPWVVVYGHKPLCERSRLPARGLLSD